MATTQTCPFGDGFDFTDPDVLEQGIPVAEFAELRKTAPVWWNEQPESIFDDGGYWVISRHEDIKAISRDGDLWSTNRKGVVMRMPDGTTPDQLELTKALLINHDAPAHTRLRKLVSRLFTPRAVATLEEKLAIAAREIVAAARREGERQLRRRHRDEPAAAGDRGPARCARGGPGKAVPLDELDHEHRRSRLRDGLCGRERRADGLRLHHGRGAPPLSGRRHRHPAGRRPTSTANRWTTSSSRSS